MMNRGGNCSIRSGWFHFAWGILSISLFLCQMFLPNRAAAYTCFITARCDAGPTHIINHGGGSYNPLENLGLQTLVDATVLMSIPNGEAVAECAVYGMDSSWDTTIHGNTNGLGIEPMAFIRAHVDQLAIRDPYLEAWCRANLTVAHLVQAKPDTPEDIINTTDRIPLRVAYRMEAPDPYSTARITVWHGGTAIREEIGNWETPEKFGIMSIPVPVTGGIYKIEVEAIAAAIWNSGLVTVVIDPFLYIEPSWQYAEYFEVLQESSLNDGEWLEVTRMWQNPVPAPPTLLLLGSGLLGLIGYGGRKFFKK